MKQPRPLLATSRWILASCVAWSVVWAFGIQSGRAAEPNARDLLPDDSAVVLEIDRPTQLLDHSLTRAVWDALKETPDLELHLATPQLDRVRQAARLLEAALDTGWRDALDRLTAGGMALGVVPGPPPHAALVVTADRPETMSQFVTFVESWLQKRFAEQGRELPLKTYTHRDHPCRQLGEAHFCHVGSRLLLAYQADDLKAMLDRQLDAAATETPAGAPANGKRLLKLDVDLQKLRELPQVGEAVRLPKNDIGQVAILGGWVDLLRRANGLQVEWTLDEAGWNLRVQADAGSDGVTGGLGGYFARSPDERAAPLLTPPGTLLSASWFRDYTALWQGRSESLTEEAARRLEEGDDRTHKQLSVIGLRAAPSEAFQMLGPHLRVVAARQESLPYRVEPGDQLPAAAFVAELRDEKGFRERVEPFFRTIGLIASGEQGMLPKSTQYRGVELYGLRSRDDEQSQLKTNRLRYSFSPTYAIAHGHLVLGSSDDIVKKVLDELERGAERPPDAPSPGTTSRQHLSLRELAEAAEDLREAAVRGIVFETGQSVPQAEQSLGVIQGVLKALDEVSVRTTIDREQFEIQLRIGPGERREN